VLVEAKCDMGLDNEDGKTAVMVAANAGHESVTVVLLAEMKELSEKIGKERAEAGEDMEMDGEDEDMVFTAGDTSGLGQETPAELATATEGLTVSETPAE